MSLKATLCLISLLTCKRSSQEVRVLKTQPLVKSVELDSVKKKDKKV